MDMKTPDKETRLKHYREVLESYVKNSFPYSGHFKGICDRIWKTWYFGERGVEGIHKLYPELNSFKPKGSGSLDYWFDTTEERIECLKKCIEMCEPSVD